MTWSFSSNNNPELKCAIKQEPEAAFLPKDPSIAEGTLQFSFLEDFVPLHQTEWSRYYVRMRLLIVPVWSRGMKPLNSSFWPAEIST